MASSVTVAQVRPANPGLRFLKLVPGLLLLAGFTLGLVVTAQRVFGW